MQLSIKHVFLNFYSDLFIFVELILQILSHFIRIIKRYQQEPICSTCRCFSQLDGVHAEVCTSLLQ